MIIRNLKGPQMKHHLLKIVTLSVLCFSLTACLGGWTSTTSRVQTGSTGGELSTLWQAKQNGVISDETYQKEKARILNQNKDN